MRVKSKKILRTLLHLSARPGKTGLSQKSTGDEPPLRSELFSSDQMKMHGKALADLHKLSLGRASDRLLARVRKIFHKIQHSPYLKVMLRCGTAYGNAASR